MARWLNGISDAPRLLVVGGASLDVLHVRGTPTPSAGGAGLYTALAAARAGAEVTMLAPIPEPMPDVLAPALDRIRWVGPSVPPERLPRFEISYGPDAKVASFDEFMGAEPEMTPALLDGVDELPGWAYCVPFLDAALQHRFVTDLRRRGCVVVAGTYGHAVRADTEIVRRTFETADVFFCNEDEATVLFGSVEAASTVPGRLLFVTLGAGGAMVYQGDHGTHVPGAAVDVLDPTGAGDTFCGTTMAGLIAGAHPVEAARRAVAAAAEEVTGVGPARLLGPAPPPGPPVDTRAFPNLARIDTVAALIGDLEQLHPFDFTGDLLPEPGDPGALDFFFAATLQQWGFWGEQDGRWSGPMVAPFGGRRLKGSDYLWAAYRRWTHDDPPGLTPGGQARVTPTEFSARMADDSGIDPLPATLTAAGLAADYGRTMSALGWSPESVVEAAAASPRPMAALLRLLDHVGGYREDPLRKKSALLGVILRQRPERWLPEAPDDDAPPIVDYHVQRTCLRTGMVEIADADLLRRLEERRALSLSDEQAVRRACFAAVERLVQVSGRSMGTVDWFLFGMRRRCPETETPDCARCPAEPACAQRVELFQPVRRTTFY